MVLAQLTTSAPKTALGCSKLLLHPANLTSPSTPLLPIEMTLSLSMMVLHSQTQSCLEVLEASYHLPFMVPLENRCCCTLQLTVPITLMDLRRPIELAIVLDSTYWPKKGTDF